MMAGVNNQTRADDADGRATPVYDTRGRCQNRKFLVRCDTMKISNIKSRDVKVSHQPGIRVEPVVRVGAVRLDPMCSGFRSGEIRLWPSFRTDCRSLIGSRSAMADAC